MTHLSESDRIWNRAASPGGRKGATPGESALSALIMGHGAIMNGGVLDAVRSLSSSEFEDVVSAFRYCDFGRIAQLLERARLRTEASEDEESAFDREYASDIAADSVLVDRFRAHLASDPGAYRAQH